MMAKIIAVGKSERKIGDRNGKATTRSIPQWGFNDYLNREQLY
jgi:hypothetical protein